MMKIKRKDLLQGKSYVGGKWVKSSTGNKIEVINPANLSRVGFVPRLSANEVKDAIKIAEKSFYLWSRKTAKERSKILKKWFDLIIKHQEDLAVIMTAEQGKPLSESRAEILYAASFVEWYAEEAKRAYGDIIPSPKANNRIMVVKQPIGVVAAITPWNFPSSLVTRKICPAIAVGCTVLLKPSEETPFSALALAKLAEEAGLPGGVLNVVTGKASEIGDEFCSSPIIRKLSFTGSTQVGKMLLKKCSDTVKKVSLELGGNAPFIVFDDADLKQAVNGLVYSKHRNMGQTCICPNRVLVQEKIYNQFIKELVKETKKLKVGNGFEKNVQQGPLISNEAVEKVESLINDAKQKGAKVVMGGKRHKLGGTFFEPTVVADVNEKMLVSREEIFGPVSCVYKFKTDDEAIKTANNTTYGLAAYFYSKDLRRITKVAEELEYGMVGVNEAFISNEVAPFGGFKQSGIGREGSYMGMEEYLETKYICLGI